MNGGGVEPMLALRGLLVVLYELSSGKLDAQEFASIKKSAEGRFITSSLSLADRADEIGAFARGGLGANGADTILHRMEALAPEDLQHVVKRYCSDYTISLVLPRGE